MEKGICNGCGKNKYIQNKTRGLCGDCVYIKNHKGKSRLDVAIEKKHILYQERKNNPSNNVWKGSKIKKSTKRIGLSDKQKEINKDLKEVYAEIDSEREPICSGCNMRQGGNIVLSHSHVISQKECKQIGRVDLITDKQNIVFHCLDFGGHVGCHRIHETKRASIMNQLLDFEKNLSFIKSVSIELYNRIVNK